MCIRDSNKDYPFAAFITTLGKYNAGELVGEWVKFPTTAEELKEVFKRIVICLLYTSLMAGGGVARIGITLVPLLAGLFG